MQQPMIIKFCLKLGKTATETNKMLKTVCENEALSHTCVFNWLEDSVRDVGPWKWSKGRVGIHCSKSWSSSTSSETGGHKPSNVSEIDWG